MDVPILGADAAKARQAPLENPVADEDAILDVETAFLVFRLPSGEVVADTNIDRPLVVSREAHPHDIIGMSHSVIGDVGTIAHAPYYAEVLISRQMEMGRQAAEARQQFMLQQELEKQQRKGGK